MEIVEIRNVVLQALLETGGRKPKELEEYQLNHDFDKIDRMNIVDEFGCDSLDFVEVVMVIEEELDVCVPDSDLEGVTKVGQLVEAIKKNFARGL